MALRVPTAARLLLAGGCLLALALPALAAAPPAAAAQQSGYLHAVGRLDGALRVAIERRPAQLFESLTASELVCSLGEGAEARGDSSAAAADWSTLAQLVELAGRPALARVESAFARASSVLHELETTFDRAWRGRAARLRLLHAGAARVRRGIGTVLASFDPLRGAFSAWLEHRCRDALAATAGSNRRAESGVAEIAAGMERLWTLPTVTRAPQRADGGRR